MFTDVSILRLSPDTSLTSTEPCAIVGESEKQSHGLVYYEIVIIATALIFVTATTT